MKLVNKKHGGQESVVDSHSPFHALWDASTGQRYTVAIVKRKISATGRAGIHPSDLFSMKLETSVKFTFSLEKKKQKITKISITVQSESDKFFCTLMLSQRS